MIDDRSLDGWCGIWVEHEMSNYEVRDHYESLITNGDLIRKADLRKWLDAEIAMAEMGLEEAERSKMMVMPATMRGILATYKAVKAHIEG